MNKNIIIAILIIIIIAIVGFFVLQPQPTTTDGKLNTQLHFLSESTIKNGDTVQFELKDATGAAIVAAPVKISYLHDGKNETYSIVTDSQGKGYLVINGEEAGSYDVTVDFAGDAKHNPCSAKQTITIEKQSSDKNTTTERQQETESNATANTVKYNNVDSSSSESSESTTYDPTKEYVSQLYYDEELGVYYDDFGTIHGGEYDGDEIYPLRTHSDQLRYPDGYSDLE